MTNQSTTVREVSNGERVWVAMRRLSASLNELREFSELAQTLLTKHKLQELETSIRRYNGLADALGAIDKRLESDIKHITSSAGSDSFEEGISFEITSKDSGKKALRVRGSGPSIKEFDKKIKAILGTDKSINHIQNSSLISLVSTTESFISNLLHIFYEAHPEALNAKDKQFTYEELSAFKSIDDAKLSVVAWRIENLLRGSVEDWIEFFEKNFKLKLSNSRRNLRNIVEIFQRRNLLVHNDGVINNIYLSKTENKGDSSKLGKKIAVSKDYLASAIDSLEITFLEIGYQLWIKLDKHDPERGQILVLTSFDSLQKERWNFAIEISKLIEDDKSSNEIAKLMCKINQWLAMRGLGMSDQVQAEVKEFDFSAKDDLFKLAQHCLLDNHDETARQAKSLVANEKLSNDELQDWPLFSVFRTSPQGQQLISDLKSAPRDQSTDGQKKRRKSENSSARRSISTVAEVKKENLTKAIRKRKAGKKTSTELDR